MISRTAIFRRIWDDQSNVSAAWMLLSFQLFILSLPYRLAVGIRNILYDQGLLGAKRLPCPVISIGNLTVGGTGKTPLAILLGGALQGEGFHPAIVSRGYGRKSGKSVAVVSDGDRILISHREAGDEPFLIASLLPRLPVIVGADRFLAGKTAIEELGADILILDDGFQHRALYRDIDILLLENSRPFGNGRLLPGGPLRESPQSLQRADIVVLTGGAGGRAGCLEPLLKCSSARCFRSSHEARALVGASGTIHPLAILQGKRIFAFSGIGNPLSFQRSIEGLGVLLAGFRIFTDHHCYDASDIARISVQARLAKADIILTTEKDGVRLAEFPEFLAKILLLRIEMAFQPDQQDFLELILDKLKAVKGNQRAAN